MEDHPGHSVYRRAAGNLGIQRGSMLSSLSSSGEIARLTSVGMSEAAYAEFSPTNTASHLDSGNAHNLGNGDALLPLPQMPVCTDRMNSRSGLVLAKLPVPLTRGADRPVLHSHMLLLSYGKFVRHCILIIISYGCMIVAVFLRNLLTNPVWIVIKIFDILKVYR